MDLNDTIPGWMIDIDAESAASVPPITITVDDDTFQEVKNFLNYR